MLGEEPMPWGFRWGIRSRSNLLTRIASEWRETLDSIEWPILALDLERRITRLNRAAQKLAGLEFHQLLGRPVGTVGSWQPWREISQMAGAVAEARTGASRHVTGDRGRAWQVSASFSPNPSAEGIRIIVVARDVTAVAQLEAQLRRAETMAAMGTLVSGVAHEVRNPLFAISATVDAVEARFDDRDELGPFVATLRGEVERLRALMSDLLEYGKPPVLDLHDVDAGEVVARALRACEPLATQREVVVRNGVEPGLPKLRLDPGRIAQVVQNLVDNALHYSPAGAAVEIQTAIFPANGRDWLEISVADRGPGFRPEDLPRIFDPFYTRRRGGTGLGLSIARRIAEAHGGTVDARNGPEGGALMTLTLPLSFETHGDNTPQLAGGTTPPGSGI